ncbi:MAG: ATP-binding cassette domain-containing protein [Clostridiales bacterium]|jgi:D-methionine transport system ATP-binding protein|nr:ATP-binding cassette domain-containing protein [Clostridiales bacterium]
MNRCVPIIRIQNLSKSFKGENGEVRALENINLEIYGGDIFGIIGVSGAGKSTLVRCINFLERPTAGTVFFDGKDMNTLTRKELYQVRQSMGMIFQQFNLLMQRNALDNVCFPLEISGIGKKEGRKKAMELLELVGLPDKANAFPSQLSGGQRQRVAIARALATNPKVLLCDEATSALDPNTTRGVLELLKDINKNLGVTVVVITHEMAVVEGICNKVAVIDEHRIAETGNVGEVFISPKSAAARRLFFPGDTVERFAENRCCRIVFDGSSSFEPVIADMVLKFRRTVNIIFADTKNIEGQAYGQMVIQLPADEEVAVRMIEYLKSKGLAVEEVKDFV